MAARVESSEVDFDGDEVQLYEYWSSEGLVDNMPKGILKKLGLKMSVNDHGEAEFTEREGVVSGGAGAGGFGGGAGARGPNSWLDPSLGGA